jgi:hypothetical protein
VAYKKVAAAEHMSALALVELKFQITLTIDKTVHPEHPGEIHK